MADWSVNFDTGKLRNAAIRFQRSVGYVRSEALLQQSVNRGGKAAIGDLAKEIRQFLPVKLKYIRKRIRFRNADKAGTQARLRIYGGGSGGSAWIRPRHAKPKYATTRPVRTAGLSARQRKATLRKQAVSYGVGGPYMPRQTVLRGFIAVVGKGRRFAMPWSSYFETQSYKANVFQRSGTPRLPIERVSGVTVGRVAQERGLLPGVSNEWQKAAVREYLRRVDVELTKRMQGGAT